MRTPPEPALDRTSRRLLFLTAAPVALLMVHFATNGTSVSFPTRRPGGATPFTWQESPLSFVLYGLMAYVATCCIVLVFRVFAKFVFEEIRLRRRR